MAITVSDFCNYFPEFKGDDSDDWIIFLQRYLDNAIARTPEDVWKKLIDQGVLYLTAHLLAISPFGVKAKLSSKSGESVYGQERQRLNRIVVSGGRVSGYAETNLTS